MTQKLLEFADLRYNKLSLLPKGISKMKSLNSNKLVLAGLICALITLMTIFVKFPIPNTEAAYVNAGDAGVYVAAYLLGGFWGAAVAATGSALADILLGGAIYALPTFIIKGAMAFIAAGLLKQKFFGNWKQFFALIIAGAVMPVGYFLYEWLIYGFSAAAISIPFNLLQWVAGTILGLLLIQTIGRIKLK